ncbi:MAG: hypothetical protein U1E50_12360 [Caulobacteraceae bacterium]
MHRRVIGLIAVIAVSLGAPAFAADLALSPRQATVLSEDAVGQPYWKLLSQCAGMFGAASNHYSATGESAKLDEVTRIGVAMLNAALDRLTTDRRIDRRAALTIAMGGVRVGRDQGATLWTGDTSDRRWLVMQSFCLDIADAHSKISAPG